MTDRLGQAGSQSSHRWQLHRAGIVNIWEYGIRELDLSGGRAILQGTNGSGKSRTLELALPLCLDGDLRMMGAKGYDSVSIRRLMLDDYTGGPNRIGYTWMELRRIRDDGMEEYLTCGIGVKASKTAQDVANAWRFITNRRIGIDFRLVTTDKTPLDVKELKEAIGTTSVFTDLESFQGQVATAVYGITDRHRYSDLLHLQRTLRNPDVGVKAVTGQVEEYLSRALPPLEPEIVSRIATQFQDLEAIRENIDRLHRADNSLSEFMAAYTGYVRARLHERASALAIARKDRETHIAAVSIRQDRLRELREAAERLARKVGELERSDHELTKQIDELEASDAYKDLRKLEDKRHTVDAYGAGAQASLASASTLRGVEQRATSTALGAIDAYHRLAARASSSAREAATGFEEAGLDRLLIPDVPKLSTPQAAESSEYVQVDLDPDAGPTQVSRMAPPELDVDALVTAVQSAHIQAERAYTAGANRRSVAAGLYETAVQLEGRRDEINLLKLKAAEVAQLAEEAAERHAQAVRALTVEAAVWSGAVDEWVNHCPPTTVSLPLRPVPQPLIEVTDDPTAAAHGSRSAHRQWTSSALARARQDGEEARARLASLEAEQACAYEELQSLRGGAELQPPGPLHTRADRTGRPGAAFYRLVEFRPAIVDAQRAGLEAALQASGLLDAWVNPDGAVVDPHLQDLVAVASAAEATADTHVAGCLLSVLVAAPPDGCDVSADTVNRLLQTVALNDDTANASHAGVTVSATGQWRAGNLTGAWSKPEAEYVGADVREATRRRRIGILVDEVDRLLKEIEAQRSQCREFAQSVAEWEQHIEDFPDHRTLVAAHAQVEETSQYLHTIEIRVQAAVKIHADAFGRWQAEWGPVIRAAADANLPHEAASLGNRLGVLDRAISACQQLRASLGPPLAAAIVDVGSAIADYHAARAERAEAEREAAAAHSLYAEAAKALSTLTGSLGLTSDQLNLELTRLRGDRQRARTALPTRRTEMQGLERQIFKLENLVESDAPTQKQIDARLAAAESEFDRAVAAPAVWLAATGSSDLVPDSREEALSTIAEQAEGDADEAQVINSLQALRATLPEGQEERVDKEGGLLIVHITDGDERRPVARAARHARARLLEDRQKLDARYRDIFEQFLLRDLADHLRRHIDAADDLCRRMNEILARIQSSQGVHVQLSWDPSPALDDATRDALSLVRKSLAIRTAAEDNRLRRALQDRIEGERDQRNAQYSQILTTALDYRYWYAFTIRVQDTGPDGRQRNRPLRRLSSGETRLVSYVTLFAAAAAFYDALTEPGTCPLRLVLLDEAFERLDDPTTTRLLELLAELDMDWIITWPGGSAFSEKINRMHVYDILKPKGAPGMAFVHTTWDGRRATRDV